MTHIAIIEDDLPMRAELARLLRSAGYEPILPDTFSIDRILAGQPSQTSADQPDLVGTAQPGQAPAAQPDLIILDINLPGLNGRELLRQIRGQSEVPVIMVTSSASDADELLSMSYGADDYVLKPYNPHILLLRIAAVLRRVRRAPAPQRFRNLRIDLDRGVIASENIRVLLTKNEMIVFRHLLEADGKIVTRDELMTDLWNNHEYINDNALTVTISRLRAKLKSLGADDAIDTRKGLGYVLV